jgi:type I restriction enzyme, S subunit
MKVVGMRIDLPSNWQWSKCNDVMDVRDGTHNTPKYTQSGYPLITSKNLTPDGIDFSDVSYISEEDHHDISKRSKVDRNDILFAMIGTIGNPVIVETDEEFSVKNVALFKFAKSFIDPVFFKYLLGTPIIQRQLINETRGGTQKFVSLTVLHNMLIPYPPIEEQKRIAAILDKADRIRRKRQEAIQLTEELGRSIFLDMFGDPVKNPKGWEKVTLGSQVIDLKYGTNLKCHDIRQDEDLPILRIPNIIGEQISWSDLKFATIPEKEKEQFLLKKEDLLFVRSNGNPEYIGRCALFEDSRPNVSYASYLIRGRLKQHPNLKQLLFVILFLFLRTDLL